MHHDIYEELLNLEEENIDNEKKLKDMKKSVMKQHLITTINENKVKINKRKMDLQEIKEKERQAMLFEQRLIEEDQQQQKELGLERKLQMKNTMQMQLQYQKKKEEDVQELDNLAQVEADKKNDEFDKKEQFKSNVRKQLMKETVMGNTDMQNNKKWHKNHQHNQDVQEKQVKDVIYDQWEQQKNIEVMEEKQHRKTLMNDLKYMMNVQESENINKQSNILKMEKNLLNDATKFDKQVDVIVQEKRKVLDKLRQDRPF